MKSFFIHYLAAHVLVVLAFAFVSQAQSMFDRVNDFDGDGRADFVVTRAENGLRVWYLYRTTAGFGSVQWGLDSDAITAGDYDGDGRTDVAVTRWQLIDNIWHAWTYYLPSSGGSYRIVEVEAHTMIGSFGIMNEDYDGDGITDPGIFQWHGAGGIRYRKSSTGALAGTTLPYFQVRVGDVVGTNGADFVSRHFNNNEMTIVGHSTFNFGANGDLWVAADIDGDNKGELVVFRPSTGVWWWIRSSDGAVNAAQWGANGDVPVPADYDGDGTSDLAIYRPGAPNGVYWVYGSQSGPFTFTWGVPGDLVVEY